MSKRNGDRSRFNRKRKAKILRRTKTRKLSEKVGEEATAK